MTLAYLPEPKGIGVSRSITMKISAVFLTLLFSTSFYVTRKSNEQLLQLPSKDFNSEIANINRQSDSCIKQFYITKFKNDSLWKSYEQY